MSAYELAVLNGYDGSIQDWLNSLQGKSAYEIAKENGYTGSEEEWTKTLEATAGKDGISVKTAGFSKDGDLLITLSDGTVLNAGKAVGAKGADVTAPTEKTVPMAGTEQTALTARTVLMEKTVPTVKTALVSALPK